MFGEGGVGNARNLCAERGVVVGLERMLRGVHDFMKNCEYV